MPSRPPNPLQTSPTTAHRAQVHARVRNALAPRKSDQVEDARHVSKPTDGDANTPPPDVEPEAPKLASKAELEEFLDDLLGY
ncbi:hypothetical protein M422DRAFT_271815 [Sphaerobolus stellatus SS14]|uniref:Uncharacterized protein n=1 Tax=Sphaerobolus stellatus (strain SS14) TaxID=990650 RepID=A0A0C9UP35_SPHS4|nr:hypothetical protein M422DRAFT_271815 [Sphaerobolus stellatus SS14]